MKRLQFKLRYRRLGEHIHTTVFSGEEGYTLANTGTLIQNVREWQLFGALLKLGEKHSEEIKQHTLVTFEGDKEIVEDQE